MKKFKMGLDAHSSTCTLAVLTGDGNLIRCQSFQTSAHHLIAAVTAYEGQRILVVEECHLADWVKRVLDPYCDEVIICDPQRNQWIWRAEHANDDVDAVKLARLLHAGFIRAITHASGKSFERRNLFGHYYDLVQQMVRIKLKLKAEFRALAITARGQGIYQLKNQRIWIKKLKDEPNVKFQVEQYYQIIDQLGKLRQQTLKRLQREAVPTKAYETLRSFPGVGPVVACGYLALIDTPERFPRKNQLWSYAGFGVRRLESDGKIYINQNSRGGNRILKWVVSEHFRGAMRTLHANKFQRSFKAFQTRGLNAKRARRAVIRQLLSSLRAAWKKGENYKDS